MSEVFDPSKEGGEQFEAIPADDYDLYIKGAAIKCSNDPAKAPYLNVQFQVLGGKHNGRTFFEICNINHAKSDVRAIAKKWLGNLCLAAKTGAFPMEQVGAVLTGKTLHARVGLEKDDYNGGFRNKIKKFATDATVAAPKPAATQPGVPF